MNETYAQHLILMKGFPATGKSTLARSLSRKLRWPLIDKDDVKDYTLNLDNGNELAYDIMWSVCRRQLSQGLSVIVDSPLTYPKAYKTGATLAKRYRAQLLVVETMLDESEWRTRLDTRNPARSKHKIASWSDMQRLLERYDGCWQYAIPAETHLLVDGAVRQAGAVAAVMERLQVRNEPVSAKVNAT